MGAGWMYDLVSWSLIKTLYPFTRDIAISVFHHSSGFNNNTIVSNKFVNHPHYGEGGCSGTLEQLLLFLNDSRL